MPKMKMLPVLSLVAQSATLLGLHMQPAYADYKDGTDDGLTEGTGTGGSGGGLLDEAGTQYLSTTSSFSGTNLNYTLSLSLTCPESTDYVNCRGTMFNASGVIIEMASYQGTCSPGPIEILGSIEDPCLTCISINWKCINQTRHTTMNWTESLPSGQTATIGVCSLGCTASPIDYDACSSLTGCTLEMECSFSGFELPLEFEIETLNINMPYLLQESPGIATSSWYNSPLFCMYNGITATCPNFFPIAEDFSIVGLLCGLTVSINVTISPYTSPSASLVPCGYPLDATMTTVQRMFDCSQRVQDYAGFGTGEAGNGYVPFHPYDENEVCADSASYTCDPTINWFLVASPSTSYTQAFWLSPVLKPGNPVLGEAMEDSLQNPMSNYTNARMLWSGLSTTTSNFFAVNGNNPLGTSPGSYAWYNFQTSAVMPSLTISGPLIYRPDPLDTTNSPILLSDPESVYVLYNTVSTSLSRCQIGEDPVLLGGEGYVWQMPSYPMLMTLTGGGDAGSDWVGRCETLWADRFAWCNPQGFRAVSNLPNFSNDGSGVSPSFLFSSSVHSRVSRGLVWVLFIEPTNGAFGSVGYQIIEAQFQNQYIRCASFTW